MTRNIKANLVFSRNLAMFSHVHPLVISFPFLIFLMINSYDNFILDKSLLFDMADSSLILL